MPAEWDLQKNSFFNSNPFGGGSVIEGSGRSDYKKTTEPLDLSAYIRPNNVWDIDQEIDYMDWYEEGQDEALLRSLEDGTYTGSDGDITDQGGNVIGSIFGDSGAVGDSLSQEQLDANQGLLSGGGSNVDTGPVQNYTPTPEESLVQSLFADVGSATAPGGVSDATFDELLARVQQQATSQAVTGTGDLSGGLQVLGDIFGGVGGALGDKAKGVVDFILDILDGVELVETDPATGKPTVVIDDTLGNVWNKAKEGWEAVFGEGSWSASGGGGEPSSGALEGIFGPLIGAGVAVATKDSQDTTEAPVTPQDTTGGANDVPENIGSTGTKGTDGGFNADRNSDDPTITGTPTTPQPTTISSGPKVTPQKETYGTYRPDETGYNIGVVDVNDTPIVDEILGTTTISSGPKDTQEKETYGTYRPDETGYNFGIQDGDNEENPDNDEPPVIIDTPLTPDGGGGGAGGFGGFSGGTRASGGGASGAFDQPLLNRRVNANEGLLSMSNVDYLRQLQERMYGQ